MQFPRLPLNRKIGDEPFRSGDAHLKFTLLDFWRWTASDLVSNSTRGVLAEFIVARALALDTGVRTEWQAFDLETASGKKIEVKSAAYVQSWGQNELSKIIFSTRHTLGWDADTNAVSTERKRQADIYVFALLSHREKETIDPMNLQQWEFYVVPTSMLDGYKRSQYSITLKSLQQLYPAPVKFAKLRNAIEGRRANAG
jgi:hypothetical protein